MKHPKEITNELPKEGLNHYKKYFFKVKRFEKAKFLHFLATFWHCFFQNRLITVVSILGMILEYWFD